MTDAADASDTPPMPLIRWLPAAFHLAFEIIFDSFLTPADYYVTPLDYAMLLTFSHAI
jgi:hypothetical protein